MRCWHVNSRRKEHLKKKRGKAVGRFSPDFLLAPFFFEAPWQDVKCQMSDVVFFRYFLWWFLISLSKKRPETWLKKNEKKWFCCRFFGKNFSTRFFYKTVLRNIFELPSLRNRIRKCELKKITSKCSRLFWKKFSTWNFCKYVLWRF
jgi:hypothetical protein